LLFESTRDGKSAIYTIREDGSGLRKLTSDSAENAEARWSPDGRRIVFTSDRDGQHELYLMNRDGSRQTRLTRTIKATLYGASFSPDGRSVVFQGDLGEGGADLQVWVIRTDGTGLRRLTDPALNSRAPAWPAGGDWITFLQRPSAGRIWKDITPEAKARADSAVKFMAIRPDGTGLREWPHGDLTFLIARWSPDGKTLYVVSPLTGPRSVYAMGADGSAVRRVADYATMPSTTASPDGRYFTYTRNAASGGGVYVYDSLTAQERLVIGGNAGAPPPAPGLRSSATRLP
jgi:TolB protein